MKSIRPKPFDSKSLRLTPEEGFVLSRVDGPLSVKDLVALTALDESRIVGIVRHLATAGALDIEEDDVTSTASLDELEEVQDEVLQEAPDQELPGMSPPDVESDVREIGSGLLDVESDVRDVGSGLRDIGMDLGGPIDEREEAANREPEEIEDDQADESDRRDFRNERLYRQIYETVFHPMDRDARLAKAATADGSELLALCLDADPVIVSAVLANPKAGIEHARMIALYHRNQLGLDHVAKRTEFLSDMLVQRRLLRNPQLPEAIFRRLVAPKLLIDAYKISIDREIPERSRAKTRELLRKKFMLSSADERAALLIKTDGRCLILLTGCPLDAHTAQILCGKTTYGVLFVQNLARFSATPPQVLAHLAKQPVVRRNQGLRKLLLQHPNMPSSAKRSFDS